MTALTYSAAWRKSSVGNNGNNIGLAAEEITTVSNDNLKAAKRLQREVERKLWAERKLKKDAVLHLRIEGSVMDRIKAEATLRDMSVSDLVRIYLTEQFSETVTSNDMPEFLLATSAFSEVVVINSNHCAACNQMLERGTCAHLAHGPFPTPRLVCGNCFETFQEQLDKQNQTEQGEE